MINVQFLNGVIDNSLIRIFIMCVAAILIAVLWRIITARDIFSKLTRTIFHRIYHENFWEDVFDLNGGSTVQLYMKDGKTKIVGHLHLMEGNSDDPWISLSNYLVYENDELRIDSSLVNGEQLKVVKLSNIESISVTITE